jgi:hypothetical protein
MSADDEGALLGSKMMNWLIPEMYRLKRRFHRWML